MDELNWFPKDPIPNEPYKIAEKFKSVQGEGVFTGTPMAFIRFVGCSVGKKICQHCDTDFEKMLAWRGGGVYKAWELMLWAQPYEHVCLTGGEPLDQHITPLLQDGHDRMFHVETSGTKMLLEEFALRPGIRKRLWICVSPKPGYLEAMIDDADEVKVIVPGLGSGDGWPGLAEALTWARKGKTVFLQPRNGKMDIDQSNLMFVQDILRDYPELRLSVQLHKILKVQ